MSLTWYVCRHTNLAGPLVYLALMGCCRMMRMSVAGTYSPAAVTPPADANVFSTR